MPATFPSHQAAVLPLKLWRPAWFDGVALVVGAASPDVAYLLDGSGLPVWPLSHQWHGLVLWCLPVTLALTWLVRRFAPEVAVHLPKGGPLALADYGALGQVRHRWWITWSSALIGAASHLVADEAEQRWPLLDPTLSVVAGLVSLALLVHIGRARLISRWHGPAPVVARRPVWFWSLAVAVALAGSVALAFLPAAFLIHTTGARILAVCSLALLAGALAARPGRPHEPAAGPA